MVIKIVTITILLILTVTVIESYEIISTSAFRAYQGGGNIFLVVGTDFPNEPTIVISNTNGATSKFTYLGNTGNEFRWRVSAEPLDVTAHKRKHGAESYTLSFYFDTTQNAVFTHIFTYVEMTLNRISPPAYYPVSNGKTLTLIGENFLINDDDTHPTVSFNRGDGHPLNLIVTSVKANEIQCQIPNIDPNNLFSYPIEVTTSTGIIATSLVSFDYVMPLITRIFPDHGVTGLSYNIEVHGNNLFDIDTIPASITVGGAQCNNLVGDKLSLMYTCDTSIVDLNPGTYEEQAVSLTVKGHLAQGNIFFTFYNPIVSSFAPKFGPPAGGTDIVVTGTYFLDVVTVWISGVECVVDKSTITTNSFTCKSGAKDLGTNSYISNKIQVDIGKGIFYSPDTEIFTYFKPVIDLLNPVQIVDQGTWKVTVTGVNFLLDNKVKIADKVFIPAGTSSDRVLYIDVDATQLTVGEHDLIVDSGSDSVAFKFKVAKPEVSAVNPAKGYLFSETTMTLTVKDFPIGLTAEDLPKTIEVKVGAKVCGKLTQVNPTTLTCVIPAGDTAKEEDISFFIQKVEYKTTLKFTYFEPKVTKQTQSSTILKGGGNLVIDGTNLDVVEKVRVDTIEITNCVIQAAQITCTIPQHAKGSVDVFLVVKDSKNVQHEYNTGTQITYDGPTISVVAPKQGSKKRAYTITLTGTGFGTTNNLITITVGGNACNNVVLITNDLVVKCNIAALPVAAHQVEISVKANPLAVGVDSIDDVTFTSNPLSCLGRPNTDNSNDPVDWWFIYKLKSGGIHPYLYMDSTMTDKLVKLEYLQGRTNQISPLQATFDQYRDYFYMFFNDQVESRKNDGSRNRQDVRNAHLGANGHLKGITIFDNIDITGNAPGIHIQHSNPVFPSYSGTGLTTFNGIDELIKFTGKPDFNQHFFCYQYDNLDHVLEYITKNDGNLLHENYRVFPNMNAWNQNDQNRFPYFYDYLTPYMALPPRNVAVGKPARTYPTDLKTNCDTNVVPTINLQDICFWKSAQRDIANNKLKAYYFMKIGTDKPNPAYPSTTAPRPPTMSKYIVRKETTANVYDGVDIWMYVADQFQKKMFIETFFKAQHLMKPTEQVLCVGQLEIPTDFAVQTVGGGGAITYANYRFSGRTDDHAKLGFPMYPAYDDDKLNPNENYFCTGDSNRHNGQGERGGGCICFQHPELVYQFNRMVRQYSTYDTNGAITHPSKAETIELHINIGQPIKLTRPNTWINDIEVEVKDHINGNHYSKMPPQTHTITAATMAAPIDVTSYFPALRNSKTNTAGPNGEATSIPGGVATYPATEPDMMNYVSTDIMSLHYIAYDLQIGSICKYKLGITDCNRDNVRSTLITQTPIGFAPADFPSVFQMAYGSILPNTYTFDITNHDDFKLMDFTSYFKTKLPGALLDHYKYTVDTGGTILTARYEPPLIYRVRDDLCGEEVAYFMTLYYIYNQARSVDDTNIIYTIGSTNPNWANGIILAISKKLYNELHPLEDANFNTCMDDIFSGFGNIETYLDDKVMDNIEPEKIVRRSAATAWDWIHNKYADGNGAKVNRVSNDDIIPITDLIKLMIDLKISDNVNSMEGLQPFLDKKYRTDINFKTILENNYIIKPPPPKAKVDGNGDVDMVTLIKLPNFSFKSTRNLQSMTFNEFSISPLVQDEIDIDTGIHQLISTSTNTINESNIISLTSYEEERLELAIDKWIVINNQSQAIQTLIIDPMTQYHDQPILFIDEFNRDQNGNQIDLASETVGTTGNRLSISTPLSISSITFVLESIIISESTGMKSFGDFEIYYLPKPNNYNGDISSDYHGMIISTINSQLCDIKMISESDFNSNKFDSICTQSGPIIKSIDKLYGSTNGGYPITLNGIRFNSSMIISIGDNKCDSTTLISSEKIICQVPKGSGIQHEIQISTEQTLFNLQRSKYLFSYNQPTIDTIEPKIIDSYGGDLLTIYGSNFGEDISKVQVFIDKLECISIVGISSDNIVCVTPSSIGDHLSITVHVNGQSTILDLDLIQSQDISYSGPYISKVTPQSGDPEDLITIIGDGFGDEDSDDNTPPLIYIGDNLVEIVNFTNQGIIFSLDYETSSQPFIIQVGDQYLTTEFDYYPPLITQFNNTKVGTSGGLIQISGFGFGVSSSDLDFTLNGNEIECNSFDQFIECYIPAGIGSNFTLNGSISNQTVDFGNNNLISYFAPSIDSYSIIDDFKLEIYGTNFVPVDLGVSFNSNSSYVQLSTGGHKQKCTTFISSSYISCDIIEIPENIQVIVENQKSDTIIISN